MKLSIVIPARNEPYLQRTVEDILSKIESDTEVLVGLDGYQDPLSTVKNNLAGVCSSSTPIGQREMTNLLVRSARGEYVMKVDAHCSFAQGFDRVLLETVDENTIVAPRLLALDVENWTPRLDCPPSSQYCFDTNLVFQYNKKAETLDPFVETMCLQGSAWIVSKENYWKWNLGEKEMGSWGSQGTELGIKAFLNGGRCVTDNRTWYAHLFRESDADFPYDRDHQQMKRTNQLVIDRYKNKSIAPLIEKFNYPADWTKEEVDKLPMV